jgi:hypothetical protein
MAKIITMGDLMTDSDDKQIAKIKKLEEQIKKKQLALQLAQGRIRERERKQRTRRLIEIGGLADIAGISDLDRGALLGAFIEVGRLLSDGLTYSKMKAEGDALLKDRETERKTKKIPEAA